MTVEPDVALVARLIGDRARAAMLTALLGGESLPATVLADRAGVSPQTASVHLARLTAAGLVCKTHSGRHRLYRLSGPKIADALEALAVISPAGPIRSLHQSDNAAAMKLARLCYDHVAGRVGVGIADHLLHRSYVTARGRDFTITKRGAGWLSEFGIDVDDLLQSRRKLAARCLDWSERRPHIGGALGAALAKRMLELGWFAKSRLNRSLRIAAAGQRPLLQQFNISGVAATRCRPEP